MNAVGADINAGLRRLMRGKEHQADVTPRVIGSGVHLRVLRLIPRNDLTNSAQIEQHDLKGRDPSASLGMTPPAA